MYVPSARWDLSLFFKEEREGFSGALMSIFVSLQFYNKLKHIRSQCSSTNPLIEGTIDGDVRFKRTTEVKPPEMFTQRGSQ